MFLSVMPPIIVPEQPAFERIHGHLLNRRMVVDVHAGVVPEGNRIPAFQTAEPERPVVSGTAAQAPQGLWASAARTWWFFPAQ